MKNSRLILKTVVASFVLLAAFFVQGAVVVINKIDGAESALIRGGIIWGLVIVTLLFLLIKNKSLSGLGFVKIEKGAAKRLLYFVPLLIIAFSHFTEGLELGNGIEFVLANIFLTVAIGMAEEIYFRGIICNMWLEAGTMKAVLISSVLFGLCHFLNIAGGASVAATILQICFAFVYGLVFALLFAIGKSIVPCVLLHALHDFCSFMSMDGSLQFEIVLGAIQFVIIVGYLIYLVKKAKAVTKQSL